MIDIDGPVTIRRGESIAYLLTVTDDEDERVDLTGATVELEIKAAVGDPDPPKVAKALGTGIALRDQDVAATKGQADITIGVADTADAAAMPAGVYALDVVIVIGEIRSYVVEDLVVRLRDVVNAPPVAP